MLKVTIRETTPEEYKELAGRCLGMFIPCPGEQEKRRKSHKISKRETKRRHRDKPV
ncbi:MAG: hypothetical protein P9M00_08760 [Candidatus Tritonobacter lacicola]|nr:hypothetical protein [Candidatus Tritonobacter lacicola]